LGAVTEDFDFALLGCKGGFETDTTNLLEGEMVTGPSAPDPLSTDMPSVLQFAVQ